MLLDETVLQQQRILLSLDHCVGDVLNLADQHLGLESVHLFVKIGSHTPLKVLRLAHINNHALGIPKLVTSGLLGHVGDDFF